MKRFFYAILLICIMLTGCSGNKGEPVSDTRFVLGTVASIQIRDHGSEDLLEGAFQILEDVENLMSTSIEGSDVWRVNQTAGTEHIPIDGRTREVVEAALDFGHLSEGRFDISMGPVVTLWGIGTDHAQIPEASVLQLALEKVDYRRIDLSPDGLMIEPGMSIDLGGIAKGYAADRVAEYLQENRVESAIINLGGNVKLLGEKEDGSAFKIGIQNPFQARNDYFGIVSLKDSSVVSSGDYERYFEQDGVRYHHIFDSESGYPVVTDVAAVTVVTEESMAADALSTVFFSLKVEEGLELAENLEGVWVMYVTKDKSIFLSEGLLEHFELTDDSFKILE